MQRTGEKSTERIALGNSIQFFTEEFSFRRPGIFKISLATVEQKNSTKKFEIAERSEKSINSSKRKREIFICEINPHLVRND